MLLPMHSPVFPNRSTACNFAVSTSLARRRKPRWLDASLRLIFVQPCMHAGCQHPQSTIWWGLLLLVVLLPLLVLLLLFATVASQLLLRCLSLQTQQSA